MPAFVIFVEGADTEPKKVPVYFVESEEYARLICEGIRESEYAIFDFSIKHCTRSDRGKFAFWAKMVIDARDGVYGESRCRHPRHDRRGVLDHERAPTP